MATLSMDITQEPVGVKTTLSLTDRTSYILQNLSGETINLSEAASAPDADAIAHKVRNFEQWRFSPASGEDLYIWLDTNLFTGRMYENAIIVTEA